MATRRLNKFDPRQARDAHGRWTVDRAVAASRSANELSARAVEDARQHAAAAAAHEEASRAHRELAKRHEALGNARAAGRFAKVADTHEQLAWGHASQAPKGPGVRRVSETRMRAARRAAETRSEREEAVTVNLPAHLLPLWRRTRRQFKGSPQQREDAFLQYVHDHPREAGAALQEDADTTLDDMIREYEARSNPRTPTAVQSIGFVRPPWTRREASAWLRDHGRRADIEETPHAWRARQLPPSDFEADSFRTLDLGTGVIFVVGHPKRRGTMARKRNPTQRIQAAQVVVGDSIVRAKGEPVPVLGVTLEADRVTLRLEGAESLVLPPDAILTVETQRPTKVRRVAASERTLTMFDVDAAPEQTDLFAARGNPKKTAKASKGPKPPTYRAAHWGNDSKKSSSMNVPDPKRNAKIVGLGELVGVIYLTQKGGDSSPTEYIHKFKKRAPVLGYGDKDGRLFVAGGDYKVTKHGIEG